VLSCDKLYLIIFISFILHEIFAVPKLGVREVGD